MWIGLGVIVFVTGRGHVLLVDNAEVDGLAPLENAAVTINGGKPVSFYPNDRDRFTAGRKIHIKIESRNKNAREAGLPFEAILKIPFAPDTLLLSLPKLVAGHEDALSVFTLGNTPPREDESAEMHDDLFIDK
jgi:hypothetical protein